MNSPRDLAGCPGALSGLTVTPIWKTLKESSAEDPGGSPGNAAGWIWYGALTHGRTEVTARAGKVSFSRKPGRGRAGTLGIRSLPPFPYSGSCTSSVPETAQASAPLRGSPSSHPLLGPGLPSLSLYILHVSSCLFTEPASSSSSLLLFLSQYT